MTQNINWITKKLFTHFTTLNDDSTKNASEYGRKYCSGKRNSLSLDEARQPKTRDFTLEFKYYSFSWTHLKLANRGYSWFECFFFKVI